MSPPDPAVLPPPRPLARRLVKPVAVVAALAAAGYLAWADPFAVRAFLAGPAKPREAAAAADLPRVELVPGRANTVRVPDDVQVSLGLRATAVAPVGVVAVRPPDRGRTLTMSGSTDFDPGRVVRVKVRFNAEVSELGKIQDATFTDYPPSERDLRAGDPVKKGDVLAVVHSLEIAGGKRDYVAALAQLTTDEKNLEVYKELLQRDSTAGSLTSLRGLQSAVTTDRIAVTKARGPLQAWRVSDREIDALDDEARRMAERGGRLDAEKEKQWARSEVLAPRAGKIVERNVAVGEYVADNTTDLFKIADTSRLLVRMSPPEDDLPLLHALPPERRRWTVTTVGVPPFTGPIADISPGIDPGSHTGVVKGYIPNPDGLIAGGQYATAAVELPPPDGVVEVPVGAVVDDHVFVQPDPAQGEFVLRRVAVVRRLDAVVFVRSEVPPADAGPTAADVALGLGPREPLRPGDRVLLAGVLELKRRLGELQAGAR